MFNSLYVWKIISTQANKKRRIFHVAIVEEWRWYTLLYFFKSKTLKFYTWYVARVSYKFDLTRSSRIASFIQNNAKRGMGNFDEKLWNFGREMLHIIDISCICYNHTTLGGHNHFIETISFVLARCTYALYFNVLHFYKRDFSQRSFVLPFNRREHRAFEYHDT